MKNGWAPTWLAMAGKVSAVSQEAGKETTGGASRPACLVAKASLMFAGLMWVLPFLDWRHPFPIPSFHGEWDAFALSLGALPLLMLQRSWADGQMPRIALLPFGLLLLALLQLTLGKIPYFGLGLSFALYMLWAMLLTMLGRRLRKEFGLVTLAAVLAACLLIGGEFSALAGLLQHYNLRTPLDTLLFIPPSPSMSGNLGQANLFADYTALGLASLGLLLARRKLMPWQSVLLAAPLLFTMALSGSRSTWLYLLASAALTYWWQRRNESFRPLMKFALLMLPGFALMQFIAQAPWLDAGSTTALQRFSADGFGTNVRFYLWREAWLILSQFPLLGAGVGQFAWQHFLLGPVLHNPVPNVTGDNAHNLLLHLAAETGMAGLLVFLAGMGAWLLGLRKEKLTLEHGWGYLLLAIMTIHSLLEYPLWYAFFLGIAALLLGMFDTASVRLEMRHVGRLVLLLTSLAAFALFQLQDDYRHLEVMYAGPQPHADEYDRQIEDGLKAVDEQLLLRPYSDLFAAAVMGFDINQPLERISYSERAMHFRPGRALVYRMAVLQAVAGRKEDAERQMERAIWAQPQQYKEVVQAALTRLALRDPEHLTPLREFAERKFEERRKILAQH